MNIPPEVVAFLEKWQTLLSGGLALLAASVVLLQIRQAERHEQERRRGRAEGARGLMLALLDNLSDYTEASADALRAIHDQRVGNSIPRGVILPVLPALSGETLSGLQSVVEASPERFGEAVAALLSDLQVQGARLRSTWVTLTPTGRRGAIIVTANIEQYMIDTATIRAAADGMFEFARGRRKGAPTRPSWEDIRQGLVILGIRDHAYPGAYETVARRLARANSHVGWMTWLSG